MAVRITVLINGSTPASIQTATGWSHVDVIAISLGDKLHAINTFIHGLREPGTDCVFVDGYVTVTLSAVQDLLQTLHASPRTLAVSGVALTGRSERKVNQQALANGGVLRGQLYALQAEFLDRMVAGGIRLPIGLYRGDGLLGSMAAHDLDAQGTTWDNTRIPSAATAGFAFVEMSPFRWQDWRRQWHRQIRQMGGRLENAAIKRVVYSGGYMALPTYADDMIRDYLRDQPPPIVGWRDRGFLALAIRAAHRSVRPTDNDMRAVRMP